jgi:hypothetical protein
MSYVYVSLVAMAIGYGISALRHRYLAMLPIRRLDALIASLEEKDRS